MALERQIKYFSKMNLSDEVEFIFVDDGSQPPLTGHMKNLSIYETHNNLAWTQGLGRNLGAAKAKGEYLFMTDLDHIISREAIEVALKFTGEKMVFRRKIGVLLENGTLTQDREILKEYGYEKEDLDASVHGNTFVLKKTIFDALGGYEPRRSLLGYHPVHRKTEDCYFLEKWKKYAKKNNILQVMGPDIYIFPIGQFHKTRDLNPMGLFHNLSQEKQSKFYKNEQYQTK